ncbi:MAG: sigma-70 family RNA polymerase sigma factor [Planctomycetales bacterium]|nr:sigma-70 family RNA polymerase sigma factor [Planctomycetales bacterium]
MQNDVPFNEVIRRVAREIAAGRESADRTFGLATLYDLTADRLVRFSVSITRRQHDAEDAVSTAMVKVASRPNLLVDADRPWHYLLRMVRNESLVILRTRSRWSAIGSIADRLIGRSTDVVAQDDENRLVWQALASLPAPQSEVVVLKIWEQLTFAEIASVLQITPSTAASRYRYALEKLSGRLATVSGFGQCVSAVSPDEVSEAAR